MAVNLWHDHILVEAVLCYGLWTMILMPLNLYWYYWRLVRHLINKDFFQMMFLLMQATLMTYFILHTTEVVKDSESSNTVYITYNLYYAGDSLLHTLFVMKYWLLSRKIGAALSGEQDKYLECKFWLLQLSLIALIVVTVFLNTFYMVSRDKEAQYNKCLNFFLSSPPCIATLILAEALFRLRNYEGSQYSISKR